MTQLKITSNELTIYAGDVAIIKNDELLSKAVIGKVDAASALEAAGLPTIDLDKLAISNSGMVVLTDPNAVKFLKDKMTDFDPTALNIGQCQSNNIVC